MIPKNYWIIIAVIALAALIYTLMPRESFEIEEKFNLDDAKYAVEVIGIDLSTKKYNLNDVLIGMNIELEHGTVDPLTNVSNDDPVISAKIAIAHLEELHDYYERLEEIEQH